jgi:hypothetical protein
MNGAQEWETVNQHLIIVNVPVSTDQQEIAQMTLNELLLCTEECRQTFDLTPVATATTIHCALEEQASNKQRQSESATKSDPIDSVELSNIYRRTAPRK